MAIWHSLGEVRFVEGPRRVLLFRSRVETLAHYRAETHQCRVVRFRDGRTQHLRGHVKLWFNPVEHDLIDVRAVETIDSNEAVLVDQRLVDGNVTRRVLHGPAEYLPETNEWLRRVEASAQGDTQPCSASGYAIPLSYLQQRAWGDLQVCLSLGPG